MNRRIVWVRVDGRKYGVIIPSIFGSFDATVRIALQQQHGVETDTFTVID